MTFSDMLKFARANWRKEEGQTMAEYGVILALIAVVVIGTLTVLGTSIKSKIGRSPVVLTTATAISTDGLVVSFRSLSFVSSCCFVPASITPA